MNSDLKSGGELKGARSHRWHYRRYEIWRWFGRRVRLDLCDGCEAETEAPDGYTRSSKGASLYEPLFALVNSEGPYHLYLPWEQPDGSTLNAHATVWGQDGMDSTCPACLLLQLAKAKDESAA